MKSTFLTIKTMNHKQFKIQPVAAFYKLLAQCFPLVFILSLVLSTIFFFALKEGLHLVLNKEGMVALSKLIEMQQSNPDMKTQTEAFQTFLTNYPNISNIMMFGMLMLLAFSS